MIDTRIGKLQAEGFLARASTATARRRAAGLKRELHGAAGAGLAEFQAKC